MTALCAAPRPHTPTHTLSLRLALAVSTPPLTLVVHCLPRPATPGTDCTEEMLEVHSDAALRQLQPYMIGELLDGEPEEGVEGPAVAVALEPECIGQGGARGR